MIIGTNSFQEKGRVITKAYSFNNPAVSLVFFLRKSININIITQINVKICKRAEKIINLYSDKEMIIILAEILNKNNSINLN